MDKKYIKQMGVLSNNKMPRGYWDNYENCKNECQRYKNLKELKANSSGCYYALIRNKWKDEFYPDRIKIKSKWENKENCIAKAKRYNDYATFVRLAYDCYLSMKENGWNVLNIAKTGEFSGSIGSNKIWTYERCKDFCKNYRYKNELRKANYQCYYVCLTNDWFDEFGILDKKIHKNGYWNNKDRCIKVARSCKDKTDFIVNHQGAYKSAVRNQWIKEINNLFAKS